MQRQQLPKRLLETLETQTINCETRAALEHCLEAQGICNQRHQRIINVFDHVLCWIHAERLITRLIPAND